jgi:hypothetical protein
MTPATLTVDDAGWYAAGAVAGGAADVLAKD